MKIGIVSISDERPNANKRIRPVIEKQCNIILEMLAKIKDAEPVVAGEPINTPQAARDAGRMLAHNKVCATIFNLPTFGFPKFGVLISLFAPGPYLLISDLDSTQPSPAGVTGVGGAFTQLGIAHERLWTNIDSSYAQTVLTNFVQAAHVYHELRGQVLGVVGGRSMGLYPMVASSKEVMKTFGVEVDNIDQHEIIRRMPEIPEEKVAHAMDWLKKNLKMIKYDTVLTVKKLQNQVRMYEVLKNIIREKQFDFTAVACHYELSEYEQPMCIAAMLSNDPYDWDGEKPVHVYACEADEDGAITMRILNMIANKPVCLLDTRYYDIKNDAYLFQNCGSAPSYFACRSCNAHENLAKTELLSCVPKFLGGGAHARVVFGAGEFTLARLYQVENTYHMLMMRATAVPFEELDSMPEGEAHWPSVAMKINAPPEKLIENLNCVHLHAVEGDHIGKLLLLCKYFNIKPEAIE